MSEQENPAPVDPSAPSPEPSHGVGAQHTILEPAAPEDDGGDGSGLADDENDEIEEPGESTDAADDPAADTEPA